MEWVLHLCVFLISLYIFVTLYSNYIFENVRKTGIKFVNPVPLFGNLYKFILGKKHISTVLEETYKSTAKDRYGVVFEFLKPIIVIKDLELLRKVFIKDFNTFHNTPFMIDENIDPVFGRILLCMRDKKWAQMRTSLTPLYTSAKMKKMFEFMTTCSEALIKHCEYEIVKNNSKNREMDFEVKDLSSRFTTDVMASTAFNFEINSFINRNNEFVVNAQKISVNSLIVVIKFGLFKLFPRIMKAFKIRIMYANTVNYITELLKNALNERRKNRIYRPDMIHTLLEAQKGNLKQEKVEKSEHFSVNEDTIQETDNSITRFNDDDLVAQAVVYILAGWGGSSHGISYTIYALANNHDIQQKLQNEIDGVLLKNGGHITYNDIIEMKYLDMVVSESLRLYSSLAFGSRQCSTDYNLGPVSEDNSYCHIVKKGESIWIPIHMVHLDPKNWPDPEKFDPERFSDENRKFIKPISYIPFGLGPRGCIGARFAVIQMKVAISYIMARFNVKTCPKTVQKPFDLKMVTFFIEPIQGFWINFEKRKNTLLKIN